MEYPKVETLFERGDDHKVDTSRIRCPELLQIKSWLVTEKIDGTNIRVCLEPQPVLERVSSFDDFGISWGTKQTGVTWAVRFYGRTDRAQIPQPLLSHLQETFTLDKMLSLCKDEPKAMTLFGEGYGARIQNGGNYRDGVSFRLFDVLVEEKWWLDWENVAGIAKSLGIKTVPILREATDSAEICWLVRGSFASAVSSAEYTHWQKKGIRRAEGIVARTNPYLFDKFGRPLRFKLKTKDF